MEQVTHDSKLEIKYSIVDEDMQSEVLQDSCNLEVVSDYCIDDEDLHHEVIVDSTSNLTVDTVEVLEVTSNLSQLPDDTDLQMKYSITDEDLPATLK